MLAWLKRWLAPAPRRAVAHRRVVARYDAAQTTDENVRHWAAADALSADAAASPEIRRILRQRARYELANGGYANGMNKQKANDLIGTGPRLQILTDDEGQNERLEAEWRRWSDATRFARTLRTACRAKVRCGEALGIIANNPKLPTLAKVHLRLVECDRLTTPDLRPGQKNRVDGIDFDADGNPTRYWILDEHPGGESFGTPKATAYPAEFVVHWYDEDRPEQHRGVSEFTPSLALLANHRRFLKATIRAAETAAEIAAVLQTAQPPEIGEPAPEPLDTISLEFGSAMIAPDGYTLGQVKAEHPATTLAEYNEQIVAEEARPLLMPANIATGNSSKYNYASGRLDNQSYDLSNMIDRDDIRIVIIEPVFAAWLRETLSEMSGISPRDIDLGQYPHEWHWDTRSHVDPSKESAAQDRDLRNGSLTYPTLYAKQGRDWRTEFTKQADALGMTLEEYQQALRGLLFAKATGPGEQDDDEDEDQEELDDESTRSTEEEE